MRRISRIVWLLQLKSKEEVAVTFNNAVLHFLLIPPSNVLCNKANVDSFLATYEN